MNNDNNNHNTIREIIKKLVFNPRYSGLSYPLYFVPVENIDGDILGGLVLKKGEEKIVINIKRIKEMGGSENDIIFALLHECMHYILRHALRQKQREQYLWNIATDIVINNFLLENEISRAPALEQYILKDVKFVNLVEEEVYEKIKTEIKIKNVKATSVPLRDTQKGQSKEEEDKKRRGETREEKEGDDNIREDKAEGRDKKGGEDEEEGIIVQKYTFEYNGKEYTQTYIKNDHNPTFDHCPPSTNSAAIAEFVDYVKKMNTRGKTPRFLEKFLDDLGIKPSSRKTALAVVRNAIVATFSSTEWSNYGMPSPIYLANHEKINFFIPDIGQDEGYKKVFIVIDQSGSITDEDIGDFIGVITQMKEYFDIVEIIIHDVEIAFAKEYPQSLIKTGTLERELKKRHACGGTSHVKVFQYIRQKIRRTDDHVLSMVVYFTDFCSDILENIHLIVNDVPNIFVVKNDNLAININQRNIKIIKM